MTTFMTIAAFFLVVFAVARATRALVFDDFPPVVRLRGWWDGKTIGSGWNELFHCPYCLGFWLALPAVVLASGFLFGWGLFLTLAGVFWVLCGWFTVGYLAGIIVASNWG